MASGRLPAGIALTFIAPIAIALRTKRKGGDAIDAAQ
jgi:cbb3-type cytochrome oxidase subunit 3